MKPSAESSLEVDSLALAPARARGAVFTRRIIAEGMLDLLEYHPKHDLTKRCILEPCFGKGVFIEAIIPRLFTAYRHHQPDAPVVACLQDCVRAVEIHPASIAQARVALQRSLTVQGVTPAETRALLDAWLIPGDFLQCALTPVSLVVGNPPYLRHEDIPSAMMRRYRQRYQSLRHRADISVAFFERGLALLREGGSLCYISSDRWLKSGYGKHLRRIIAEGYALRHYLKLHTMPAFSRTVHAYPAIITLQRAPDAPSLVLSQSPSDDVGFRRSVQSLLAPSKAAAQAAPCPQTMPSRSLLQGESPWVVDNLAALRVLRRLETTLPRLETVGVKVGIGVASGADAVFIAPSFPVEPSRSLPLAMAGDITAPRLQATQQRILNPFAEDGSLVKLQDFPALARYLMPHEARLRRRYVVQKRYPEQWYRTIDRMYPPLCWQAKLLIPDICNRLRVSFDDGTAYPHHNLCVITSSTWDLRVLQAILRSQVGQLFLWAYSPRINNGYMRVQAQHLRRICLPAQLDPSTQAQLRALAWSECAEDIRVLNSLVNSVYGLCKAEAQTLAELFGTAATA